ncbi:MAG: TolC family protein [Gammaproteobacteria bacterium]|nr:TolC family protein [Gammaproteobacteria bacterium]
MTGLRSTCRYLSLILAFHCASPAFAGEAAAAENLADLVAAALASNPELKASEARWEMFRNRIKQAEALDDPMLMLKIQNGIAGDPFNFRKDPMTQKVVGLSQALPFWGKRALRGEMAAKQAEFYQWQLEERKLELKRMVKESYYQIFFVDKASGIVEKNIKILDDFITLSKTKYAVGQGVQQDIFKAQVERSRMLDMQIALVQQRTSLQANLNALLYRPADSPVGGISDFEPALLSLSAAELTEISDANRPLVKGYTALIEKGQAGRKLAQKEYYPDFNAAFEYMQRNPVGGERGLDMYAAGITLNLPVQRERRSAMLAESNAEISMAAEELNALKNTISYGVADLLAQLEKRKRLIELYKTGIIPQAQRSLESAIIGYRVNKVDLLTLLDNRVTLFNYEREYYDSLADYQMKLAQLEAMVGKELQ